MEKKRLNVNITDEAYETLKNEAERYGATMGAIVSIWASEKKKAGTVLDGMAIIKEQYDKGALLNMLEVAGEK